MAPWRTLALQPSLLNRGVLRGIGEGTSGHLRTTPKAGGPYASKVREIARRFCGPALGLLNANPEQSLSHFAPPEKLQPTAHAA